MSNAPEARKTILVVEDNEISRELLYEYLKGEYNVLLASNAFEAMDIIDEKMQEISLVLLDIVMPDFSGLEMLETMNENGWIEFLPVVIVSSEGSDEYKHTAYLNNVCDFITKPFTNEEVISCIKRII